jgi:hypothetical protein
MALFRRRRAAADEVDQDGLEPGAETGEDGEDGTAPEGAAGPFDVSQRPDPAGLVDFGALRVPLDRGAKLTVEVARETGQPVAVVLTQAGSRIRLTAFAAPKSAGLWRDVMRAEQGAVEKRGGSTKEQTGRFGPELVAQLPTTTAQGRQGKLVVRLLGVDGPRWLLRAEIGGKAARDPAAAEPLEELFSQVVVDRGASARPPREPLPLHLPKAAGAAESDEDQPDEEREDPTALLRRGPEITEVR